MYKFDLEKRDSIESIRSPQVYQYNLAQNLALLSNDSAVIRSFYQYEAEKFKADRWLVIPTKTKFLAQYREGQAYAYFGLIPMIVQAKVNLVASNGFSCKSKDKEIDKRLNEFIKEAELKSKFAEGVYLESGLGDFLFRLSFDPDVSDKPLIDVIEPQNFEINYARKKIKSIIIKIAAAEDPQYELREIWYKTPEGKVGVTYRFHYDGKYVSPKDTALAGQCALKFDKDLDLSDKILPFDDFPLIFKKNANSSQLYRGERGVPDIQGLDTIEDALAETFSDLIDAIRKGGVIQYVSEDLLPQDASGNILPLDQFNKTVLMTKGSANPASTPKSLLNVVQGDIKWEAYVKTIQTLMSTGINKAGLSPTTLGLTGLESINSSAESQEAREKTSLRTRELCLASWTQTLTELLNKYLQLLDYIDGQPILDYRELINIHFDDYINPSVENVTEVIVNQVAAGVKSHKHAIKELNPEYTDKDAEDELLDIMSEQGQPVLRKKAQNPM